jgi:hypothetical protein
MLVVVSVPPERIGRDSSKARTRLRGPEGEPFIGTAVANVSFKSLPPADSTSFLRPTNSPRGLWRRPETATTVQIWTFHFLVLIFLIGEGLGSSPSARNSRRDGVDPCAFVVRSAISPWQKLPLLDALPYALPLPPWTPSWRGRIVPLPSSCQGYAYRRSCPPSCPIRS